MNIILLLAVMKASHDARTVPVEYKPYVYESVDTVKPLYDFDDLFWSGLIKKEGV